MILRGIKEAAFINTVVTIAKIVPIIVFVVFVALAFDSDLFVASFWGGGEYGAAEIFNQVRSTMLVTVFVFIGVEGASVYSRFAKKRSDVGFATVTGFLGVLCLMVLVTLLCYGVLSRPELAGMRQPSMAGVLESVVGPWGAMFVSVGLIVSVLGAFLAWSLLAAEVAFSAARSDLMPAFLKHENQNEVPSTALWLTNGIVQLFLIATLFAQYAFDIALELTSAMTLIPYVLVAGYGLKLAQRGETYEVRPEERSSQRIIGVIATIYTIFMIIAGGLKFVLLSCILFAPGTLLFYMARREQKRQIFTKLELVLFVAIAAGAVVGIYALATGAIAI
jgi:arginine:ornithine antiporter/lysine permease